MDESLLYKNRGSGLSGKLGSNHTTTTWLRLESTSEWITLPIYIYIVFKPLPMQWMDIWMHCYCIKTMEVGSVAKAKLNLGNKWVQIIPQ